MPYLGTKKTFAKNALLGKIEIEISILVTEGRQSRRQVRQLFYGRFEKNNQ